MTTEQRPQCLLDPSEYTESMVHLGRVQLHVVQAGPKDGPPVVLLHGFPEMWFSWRYQIRALAAAGFRVIAPDQRGYNTSDKPGAVADYAVQTLAMDVADLVTALGYEQVSLVGHDWGGAVAWMVASLPQTAQVVRRLGILNAPHPALFLDQMSLKQLRKSWYMFLFQLPAVPEWLISRNNFKLLRGMLRYSGYQRPVMSEAEYQIFAAAFMQPGALTAAINYYRAALRGNPLALKRQVQPVSCPTLLIWGEKDVALGKELTYGLSPLVPRLRVQYIEDAGHWVQQEKPEDVNRHLLQFLQAE